MPSSTDPIRENNPTLGSRRTSDIEADRPNSNLSPTSSVPPLLAAETHYDITCKKEKDWWDKAKPFVEIIGLLVLAVYSFYTIKLYWNAVDSERPWIKVSTDFLPRRIDSPEIAILHISNSGNTPAIQVTWNMWAETIRSGDDPNLLPFWVKTPLQVGVIFPNQKPFDFQVYRKVQHSAISLPWTPGPVEYDPITEEDINLFNDNKLFFLVYAEVHYADSLGVRHWTKFCGYLGRDWDTSTSRECFNYNTVDNNK
jgi:hypothetical protein